MGRGSLGQIQSQILWNRLLAVVEECDYLNDYCRNECSEYLRSFFQVLESEGENLKSKFVASEGD